jgi:hypothetical protein
MKKNLRKIPNDINEKIKSIKGDEIVVGCAVKFKIDTIASGKLKHLGIEITPEGLRIPKSLIPSEDQGKFSSYNINGIEIVRKDLPKETHYNSIESPNWGDSYNGTHTVNLPYKKYPREFHSPRELEIIMDCKDIRPNLPNYVIAFRINEVISKKSSEFQDILFEDLNLLQENIGSCGIEPADVPLAEYVKSLQVSWEILPPGTIEETVARIFHGRISTTQEKNIAAERYEFFKSFNPKSLIFGNSGFRRYFGALLEENLVLFENIQYGNAIYILFNDWEDLSKRSRIDLIAGKFGDNFERIVHNSGWKGVVRKIVEYKRKENEIR